MLNGVDWRVVDFNIIQHCLSLIETMMERAQEVFVCYEVLTAVHGVWLVAIIQRH